MKDEGDNVKRNNLMLKSTVLLRTLYVTADSSDFKLIKMSVIFVNINKKWTIIQNINPSLPFNTLIKGTELKLS